MVQREVSDVALPLILIDVTFHREERIADPTPIGIPDLFILATVLIVHHRLSRNITWHHDDIACRVVAVTLVHPIVCALVRIREFSGIL